MKKTHLQLAVEILEKSNSWDEIKIELDKYNVHGETTQAGFIFEWFAVGWLKNSGDYKEVYALEEAPRKLKAKLDLPNNDVGIDGIAVDHDNNIIAIQVKYSSNGNKKLSFSGDRLANMVSGQHADKFLVFTNCRGVQDLVLKMKENFQVISKYDIQDITKRQIDALCAVLKGEVPEEVPKLEPYDYQQEAIDKTIAHAKIASKGTLILPTGTGKTFTSLRLKEQMGAKKVLFLAPKLSLVRQTVEKYKEQRRTHFNYMSVCSAKDLVDETETELEGLSGIVSTDPHVIANFLSRNHGERILFACYNSLQSIVDAVALIDYTFDLIIFDEAHYTATAKKGEAAVYQLGLSDESLPAKFKLFMTATKKVFGDNILEAQERGEDLYISDMGDEKIYGKEVHHMTLGEARKRKLVCDYKIVGVVVTDQELKEHLQDRTYVEDGLDIHQAAAHISMAKAMEITGDKYAISFHARCAEAKYTSDNISCDGYYVDGEMPSKERADIFKDFVRSDKAILSNAQCLSEGIDIPEVSMVFFNSVIQSNIRIIQSLGRALRKDKNNPQKTATVVLPIYTDTDAEVEETAFASMYSVLMSVAAVDIHVEEEIRELAESKGALSKRGSIDFIGGSDHTIEFIGLTDKLKEVLMLKILPKAAGLGSGTNKTTIADMLDRYLEAS